MLVIKSWYLKLYVYVVFDDVVILVRGWYERRSMLQKILNYTKIIKSSNFTVNFKILSIFWRYSTFFLGDASG